MPSTGSAVAEGVTAVETDKVVEYVGIDGVTEGSAGCAASRATDEATEDGASNATECNSNWAGQHADRSAGFGTGNSHSDAAYSTGEGTHRAADLGCVVESVSARGLTARAGDGH